MVKHKTNPVSRCYATEGLLALMGPLCNQGNLHLINIELKSIVSLIKDTSLDSPTLV